MSKVAFEMRDFFFNLESTTLPRHWRKYWCKDRIELAGKIFAEGLLEILLDIINNNVTFVLPLKFGKYAEIYMKQFSDEKFIELYKIGAFNKIDFVKSGFTGNQLQFRYNTMAGPKDKPIRVTGELKKLITDHTHQAKQYY